jgi:predicted  nucleic acid-binding Zn-ribbon protein
VNELKEQIKILIDLQDCDIRIGELVSKKEEGPIRIRGLMEELKVLEGQFEEELNRLEACKKGRKEVEQKIEDLESRAVKSAIKLDNVKSNKEYQAALKEIDALKREKTNLEDRAIEIMEEIEDLETEHTAGKKRIKEFKGRVEQDRENVAKELKALERDLEMLEKERGQFCQAVDAELLGRYSSLRKNNSGFAVSPVIKGVCQTCHIGIPTQEFNELIKGEGLMACPNCLRIIYWGEDKQLQAETVASE